MTDTSLPLATTAPIGADATLGILIDVPLQRIADLMVTAIEGNPMTRSWCAGVFWQSSRHTPPSDGPWYADANVYRDRDFAIAIHEIIDESKTANGRNLRRHRCDLAAILRGLSVMATKHGSHFGDWLAENEDIITADVFLQCVALGEVRYG